MIFTKKRQLTFEERLTLILMKWTVPVYNLQVNRGGQTETILSKEVKPVTG
jgi:hypothetical protein